MALKLIVGPPGSGRAGEILAGIEAALARDPVLVVPTLDDAERFEAELAERGALGARILTFRRLFEELARAVAIEPTPALTRAQRLRVAQLAAGRADLGPLTPSASRAGFPDALAALVEELGAALADPHALERRAFEAEDRLAQGVAAAYRACGELRDELGRGDEHALAAAATAVLRAAPDAWGGRPVYVYGFDDLTEEQLEAVRVLAGATEVTVAVAYEDRPALAARARLHERLRELGPERTQELESNPAYTKSATLVHLERAFAEPDAERIEPDHGLALLRCAGERGEAEAVAAEAARLLSAGVEPDEIAIVLRDPTRHGALYENLLAAYGVPAAVDARVSAARTAAGRALIAHLRLAFDGDPEAGDVLACLRAPGVADGGAVDWLERTVRRGRLGSAAQALDAWSDPRLGRTVEALRTAAGEGELLRAVADLARELAERPLNRKAALPARGALLELRVGAELARAAEEISELGAPDPQPAELRQLLETLTVPLWRGSARGRVRVCGPRRLRARRFRHVIVASLQDGDFPRREAEGPFLSDAQREALGLPARIDPGDEERYLFAVCLSRPTERLCLSWRDSEDDGSAATPSPFLDDVRELLVPPPPENPAEPDPVEARIGTVRGLGDVVHEPLAAPTARELARALAGAGLERRADEALAALGVEGLEAAAIGARLAGAAERAATLPGPLRAEGVVPELAERKLFGASTLESYAECPYRWFVDHELRPGSLDPDPEALARGDVVHRVLEALYSNPPGGDTRPRSGTVSAWRERALELLAEIARGRGLAPVDAPRRALYRGMESVLVRTLDREAAAELPLVPDPALVEAAFGGDEDGSAPPLELEGFALHGRIDRIDVEPGAGATRRGLVRDHKTGRKVPSRAELETKGKLQLPLYALAARRLLGIDPIGAIYDPLGADDDKARPRGLLLDEERDGLLADPRLYPKDFADRDEFERALADAEQTAAAIVARMHEGHVAREPRDGKCPRYCTFQPICRKERRPRSGEEIAEAREET